jgi:hypothetical protein
VHAVWVSDAMMCCEHWGLRHGILDARSGDSRKAYDGGFDAGVGASVARLGRMIRKLKSGKYRLYSRKIDPRTNRRRNLGTFDTREAAEKHERAVQYFKRRS